MRFFKEGRVELFHIYIYIYISTKNKQGFLQKWQSALWLIRLDSRVGLESAEVIQGFQSSFPFLELAKVGFLSLRWRPANSSNL